MTADATTRQRTISSAYADQQTRLHENPNYGVASLNVAPIVAQLLQAVGAQSLCDYGAGKQNLLRGLAAAGVSGLDYRPYDPAFPSYGPPRRSDVVACIDVMEHVEPEFIDAVLGELRDLTIRAAFISICTRPAGKTLPDGRNAHLIQRPASWWLVKLCGLFDIMKLDTYRPGRFWIIATPLNQPG